MKIIVTVGAVGISLVIAALFLNAGNTGGTVVFLVLGVLLFVLALLFGRGKTKRGV